MAGAGSRARSGMQQRTRRVAPHRAFAVGSPTEMSWQSGVKPAMGEATRVGAHPTTARRAQSHRPAMGSARGAASSSRHGLHRIVRLHPPLSVGGGGGFARPRPVWETAEGDERLGEGAREGHLGRRGARGERWGLAWEAATKISTERHRPPESVNEQAKELTLMDDDGTPWRPDGHQGAHVAQGF